ncbi:MBL fold metallo-hydrolase [Nitratireductor sp. CH_MIT9313-5]|uniref:MBL fold metallo-hydrolase n=1 Tax=Nitratireductor sp. CH_MIT9313-5 TaxID=3107764 RepID=UPI0030098135
MKLTRRHTLALGVTAFAAIKFALPSTARAQLDGGDAYALEEGQVTIHPISHASFVMELPDRVIYVDPVGGAAAYEGMPDADLILITHEHGDHYDAETLATLVGEETRLVTNPAVFEMLGEDMKARATSMANGDSIEVDGLPIEAIPAYNITEERLKYHPKGRDNGYILTTGGKRIYIAGDTEDIPEMRALEDIYIAFVPMNLPYTMTIDQAASAVAEFQPDHVYPYHYRDSDVEAFAEKVAASNASTKVVMGGWYDKA